MKLNRLYTLFIITTLLLISCGGGGDDSGSNDDGQTPAPTAAPEAASLIFPEDNTVCNISEILSETQSRVTFQWNASDNTDSYELTLRNLESGNILRSITNETEAPLTIERGTPYEWTITSMADGVSATALSASFRFFNEGPGIQNFIPFPAEVVNPNRGESFDASITSVDLVWNASDVDNDISSYEIFFGTDIDTLSSLGQVTEMMLEGVEVSSNNTYFWNVETMDSSGNVSISDVFQFRVN